MNYFSSVYCCYEMTNVKSCIYTDAGSLAISVSVNVFSLPKEAVIPVATHSVSLKMDW